MGASLCRMEVHQLEELRLDVNRYEVIYIDVILFTRSVYVPRRTIYNTSSQRIALFWDMRAVVMQKAF